MLTPKRYGQRVVGQIGAAAIVCLVVFVLWMLGVVDIRGFGR